MAIHLPERTQTSIDTLTPREIVAELDKHVIGQHRAKRAVAIALRTVTAGGCRRSCGGSRQHPRSGRRRGQDEDRAAARAAGRVAVSQDMSKFTGVSCVGRDVESMIPIWSGSRSDGPRRARGRVRESGAAEERLLDLLLPPASAPATAGASPARRDIARAEMARITPPRREKLREQLRAGRFEGRPSRLKRAGARCRHSSGVGLSMERSASTCATCCPGCFKGSRVGAWCRSRSARAAHPEEARSSSTWTAWQKMPSSALRTPASSSSMGSTRSPVVRAATADVSREGVRDILPIVEGTRVTTKCGAVRPTTSLCRGGGLHVSKPST